MLKKDGINNLLSIGRISKDHQIIIKTIMKYYLNLKCKTILKEIVHKAPPTKLFATLGHISPSWGAIPGRRFQK